MGNTVGTENKSDEINQIRELQQQIEELRRNKAPLPSPWREVGGAVFSQEMRDKLLQKIKSTELPDPCQAINLIVVGQKGSGKSSFVNTCFTVLRNSSQISTIAASYGVNYSSTTNSLHEITLLRNWNEKKLRIYDCRGVETPNEYYEKDLIKAISGCIKKDYKVASLKKVFIHDAESSDADAHGREMTVEKQEIYKNYNRSCHGTILIKSILCLALFFLTCAGGTGHGNDQLERQDHSEIVKSTLRYVSNCPNSRGHIQITNCADVCGRNCTYHCMRDSSKTKLVEFCAIPEILFGYCPEYDPVDHTIQKDQATPCNSKFSQSYYYSSDIFFCDPDNCLQVHGSNVRSGATTLTTLMTGTTEINGGDNPQAWFSLILLLAFAATF